MSDRTDWIAHVYDEEGDTVIDAWFIEDRTEDEARDETKKDATHMHPGRKWALSKAEEMVGGRFRVGIGGSVWVEVHTEGLHDVLHDSAGYAIEEALDLEVLEEAVKNAVYDHLAKRDVIGAEVEAFEEYLDAQGREMVEVEIYAR